MKKVRNIPGIGVSSLVPRRASAKVDVALDAEQGFVYSRVDGKTAVGDIFSLVPFTEARTTELLLSLWQAGLIDLPGRERPKTKPDSPTPSRTSTARQPATTAGWAPPPPPPARQKKVGDIPFPTDPEKLPELKPEPPRFESRAAPPPRRPVRAAAPLDDIGLSAEERERIDVFVEGIDEKDAFALLEISPAADAREVKRAYFRLSKEFHPDRYYGKELGPYRDKLSLIFRAAKGAFELLSDKSRREAYEHSLKRK